MLYLCQSLESCVLFKEILLAEGISEFARGGLGTAGRVRDRRTSCLHHPVWQTLGAMSGST